MSTQPGVPSDNTTLTDVLAAYEAAGFAGQFEIASESAITCLTCENETAPGEFAVSDKRRLEGASDPDDMLSIVAITCPRCGARGAMVLGFGPNASETDASVGKQLGEGRGQDSVPPFEPG